MKAILYFSIIWLTVQAAYAQIGMGGQPHPSAVLDLKATDKGFYPPRLTTAQRKAITNAQPGMFVYDLDQSTFYLYDGANWLPLAFQNPNSVAPTPRTATDGAPGDYFGNSVAISGDYAIVGAPYDQINSNTDQGSAYIFVRSGNTWTQQAKIIANDGTPFDNFGTSVAISGDYAVVGAPYDQVGSNQDQGSAYVFVRSGTSWTQQTKITANDGAAFDNYGWSVSISGDYALVGARNADLSPSINQGAAYVYARSGSTWPQQAKLTANDAGFGDLFGSSVSISGTYALIGAPYDDISGSSLQGSAYVFTRSGTSWSQSTKITANDGSSANYFGESVAISGDYAVVGAPYHDVSGVTDQGAAYVYARSGSSWPQQSKLFASDGAIGDQFGSRVAISGDYVLVGVRLDDVNGITDQGSGYIFRRSGTTWSQLRQIVDNSPTNTYNGISVGIANGTFIIGGSGFQNAQGKVSFGVIDN